MSELEALPVDELEEKLAALAAHISAGMCSWLALVSEFDRRGTWARWGYGSCAEWLAWRGALTPGPAREHVRVARGLLGLPLIRAAFSRGELSYAKVRALTRVAELAKEQELLELAEVLTASQLERALRAYRNATSEDARELHERERFDCYWDEDGSLMIRGRLASEDGALLMKALEVGRERLWQAGQEERRVSAETRPAENRLTNLDALVAVADSALAHETGRTGGDRYQVVVHIDGAALTAEGDSDGSCSLADGPALAPETARRLACDASVVTVIERHGVPLSVGRKTRTIPRAVRRALKARDRGCRFPGCDSHRFVDAHHVRHWAHGGETALANLVLLCRRHHRLVHEGGYTVDQNMRFYDPHGHPLPPVPPQPPGTITALQALNRDLEITEKTCKGGYGNRMDLSLAVSALLGIIGRPSKRAALDPHGDPRSGSCLEAV